MINYLKRNKQQVKYYLIIVNVTLSIAFLALLFVGLAIVRPNIVNEAIERKQYIFFNINNPPVSATISETIANKSNGKPQSVVEEPINSSYQPDKQQALPVAKPKIAIIVTNLGVNRQFTELTLTLPVQIGLGFLPYVTPLTPLLHTAHKKGFEIYLYLPFQTDHPSDNPGRYALETTSSEEENKLNLDNILSSHKNFHGVYSSYKEKFTLNQQATLPVLSQIKERGLVFILGNPYNPLAAEYLKQYNNIIATSLIIDQEPDEELIKQNLRKLVEHAKQHKVALGYIGKYPLTISLLKEWLKTPYAKSVELVPISTLFKSNSL